MLYTQSKKYRPLIEVFMILSVLFLIDYYTSIHVIALQPSPFILIVMLFSLKYGWKTGIFSFLFTLAYFIADLHFHHKDILLLFIDFSDFKWILLLLSIALVSGFYSTSMKECYEDFINELNNWQSKATHQREVISKLNLARTRLRKQVLGQKTMTQLLQDSVALMNKKSMRESFNALSALLHTHFGVQQCTIFKAKDTISSVKKVHEYGKPSQSVVVNMNSNTVFYKELLTKKTADSW